MPASVLAQAVSGLMIIAATTLKVPLPEGQPVIKEVTQQEVVDLACKKFSQCKDVYAFTDPLTNEIYTTKVDYNLTIAQAEVLHEIGRWVLTKNDVYTPNNSCSMNMALESSLNDLRMIYIQTKVKSGTYKAFKDMGLPNTAEDLGKHIFFCIPDEAYVPPKKTKKSKQPEVST